MPLSDDWTDSIIRRLHTRYGSAWTAKWASLPADDVRADWADALDGLSYERVRYGLANLPTTFPPNAGEFHAICMQMRPPTVVPTLQVAGPPPTPVDKERVRQMLAKARAAITGGNT